MAGAIGHVAILAAFAVVDVEAGRLLFAVNVLGSNADGFADAQAAMIDQAQAGLETQLAQRGQHGGDFLAGEDDGQDLGFDDAHLLEDRPGRRA